jgi:hypothetical protein
MRIFAALGQIVVQDVKNLVGLIASREREA